MVTSRVRDRLFRELETSCFARGRNRLTDKFLVSGRGELHLGILVKRCGAKAMSFRCLKPGNLPGGVVNLANLTSA